MPNTAFLTIVLLVVAIAVPFNSGVSETLTFTTIELPSPIHFTASDGNDVVLAPGTYQVTRATESNLTLTRPDDPRAIEIQAGATAYGGVPEAPTALLIAEDGEDDELHLVLLSPDGDDRDAIGTLSGTCSRATRLLSQQQTNYVLAMARYPIHMAGHESLGDFIFVPQGL